MILDSKYEHLEEQVNFAIDQIEEETIRAINKFGLHHSSHEAYAVLLEEVDELWEHVRRKRESRDLDAMERECIQIAAVAVKFALLCRQKSNV